MPLAIEKYLSDDPPSNREWVAVKTNNRIRFYDISNWTKKIDRLKASYSGRGLSDDVLRGRIRAEIKARGEEHIRNRRPGLIHWPRMEKAIRARLDEEIRKHEHEVKTETETNLQREEKLWRQYLNRTNPPGRELEELATQYREKRASLVGKNRARKTCSGAFTHCRQNVMLVRIGLDFGTSSIKAAYRGGDEKTIPLRLGKGTGIEQYIMNPTMRLDGTTIRFFNERTIEDLSWKRCLSCRSGGNLVCTQGKEKCPLERKAAHVPEFQGMDMLDMTFFLASVYLGYVLKRINAALVKDLKKRYGTGKYRCSVHMCVPIGDMQKDPCKMVFQDALTLADQMFGLNAFEKEPEEISTLLRHWEKCRKLPVMLEESKGRRGRVFPEVYAEIASYAASKVAVTGAYILIDIGAGTVDMNVFRWVTANRTSVWASYCDGTGVLELEEKIMELLSDCKNEAVESCVQQMDQGCFPDMEALSVLSADPQNQLKLKNALNSIYKDFCDKLAADSRRIWGEALLKKGNEPWNKLGVFIGGGGAALKSIDEYLLNGIRGQVSANILHDIRAELLPLPDEDEFEKPARMAKKDFHRLAVAYGLTLANNFEDNLSFPKNIRPRNNPDDPYDTRTNPHESRFIRHEDT